MSDSGYSSLNENHHEQYTLNELLDFVDGGLDLIDEEKLANTSPYEVGCFLERLSPEDQQFVMKKLSWDDASNVLAEMDSCDSAEILADMRDYRAVKILEKLEPDDAVDLLLNVEVRDRERLLSKLPADFAKTIRNLMRYDPDTAGGVMTPYVTTLHESMTVDQAIQYIRSEKNETENTDILYVIDEHRRLVGLTTVRHLIWSKASQKISQIMEREILGICHPDQSKKEVAMIMTETHMQTLPVVDVQGRLLGIITHDDVIDILHETATSDMQKMCGAGSDEHITDDVFYSVRKRVPWLIVNLFLSLVSTEIIARFSNQIQEVAILAAFMNLITVISDNAGAQSLTIAIRGLALGEILPSDLKKIYLKEVLKGLLNGTILGLLAALLGCFWSSNLWLSVLVFLSVQISVVLSGLMGAFIPIMLKRLKLDPANSATIILTAIGEPIAIFLFLWMGSVLLCK